MAQSSSILNDRGLSDWVVHWGQFLTHDMTLIDTGAAYNVLSTGATGDFSIPITDPSDPLGPNPITFNRSKFDPATGNGDLEDTTHSGVQPIPRWQINSITSYIDASNVYGSDQATADSLRHVRRRQAGHKRRRPAAHARWRAIDSWLATTA